MFWKAAFQTDVAKADIMLQGMSEVEFWVVQCGVTHMIHTKNPGKRKGTDLQSLTDRARGQMVRLISVKEKWV